MGRTNATIQSIPPAPDQPGRRRRWRKRLLTVTVLLGVSGGGVLVVGAALGPIAVLGTEIRARPPLTVSNLAISATSSPWGTDALYPGATGDVVITIDNPNAQSVTISAVDLPANTSFAAGYTSSTLRTVQIGCSRTTSDVIWNASTPPRGSVHTLVTPLTVAADQSLMVTLTDAAMMGPWAPAACEATYFTMPPFEGVAASTGNQAPTALRSTDRWTSRIDHPPPGAGGPPPPRPGPRHCPARRTR